jgi:hypothetical protein
MNRSLTRLAAVAVLGMTALVTPVLASASAPGPGTFSRVTSPAKTLTYRYAIGKTNSIHVSGRTSLDVTQVDIDCITYVFDQEPDVETLASAVPVSSGAFSAEGTFSSNPEVQCRLAAVPDGVDPRTDYIGSFTGPIIYLDAFGVVRHSGRVYSYTGFAEQGDGTGVVIDAGTCGTELLITVQAPQMLAGPIMINCFFALSSGNFGPAGSPNRSTIQIDGHNAYLPSGVEQLLINDLALPVTQSTLTVTHSIASNGNVTFTESALLMRCSAGNAYPPTITSCPHLVSTGVRYQRISTFGRDGHQMKVRDTFTSTNHHAHSASLDYQASSANQTAGASATGNIGYLFPRHGSSFLAGSPGKTITGLGPKAGTVLIRSDLHALSTDGEADTTAGTWSRPPSKVFFDTENPDEFQMQYALHITASRPGFIGFAVSERWATAAVKALAAAGAADFVAKPTITSPHHGATVHGTSLTVKGSLTAGANGLPTAVRVNGHLASITVTSATHATYKVTFHEPAGKHAIKVVATDAVGNSSSASSSVKVG